VPARRLPLLRADGLGFRARGALGGGPPDRSSGFMRTESVPSLPRGESSDGSTRPPLRFFLATRRQLLPVRRNEGGPHTTGRVAEG
jgi:hypothetical protein